MNRAERLPDCYRKDEYGNIYKLLYLNASAIEELKRRYFWLWGIAGFKDSYRKRPWIYVEKWLSSSRGLLNDEAVQVHDSGPHRKE